VKRLLILLVPALAVTVPLATAQARTSSPEATDAALTSICHRTSSARRPYVKLRVTARQRTAHLRHAADIIPAGAGACPRTILSPTSAGTALRIFMTGEADVPTGDPVGTGEATIRLRRGQGQICYSLEVQNITLPSVGAHIHRGGAGESGPIVVPLRQPGANGQSSGCATVSRAIVSQILANRSDYYVNVHTTDFPGGAVRGQLTGTTEADLGRTMTVTLNGASECNAAGTCNLGDADGAGTTVFRFRSGNVCYRVRVSNIRHAHPPRHADVGRPDHRADERAGRERRLERLHRNGADADRRDPRDARELLQQRPHHGLPGRRDSRRPGLRALGRLRPPHLTSRER
jgi:hypothetical protein